MAIPEKIRALKPTQFGAVEIREFSGHYYVYEIGSKWDPVKKKAKKVTGKAVGKITEKDGFIPNLYGARKMTPLHPVVKNYGAYEIVDQLSGPLESRLKKCFPDIYREISTIAKLQLVTGCKGKRIKREFEASYLTDLHPDLPCSDHTVKTLVGKLGLRQSDMDEFMKSNQANMRQSRGISQGSIKGHDFTGQGPLRSEFMAVQSGRPEPAGRADA